MIYSIINIGLVDSILFDNGAKVVYTYAMNGEKLRVRHHAALTSVVRPLHAPVEGGIFPGTPVSFILYDEESYYGGDIVKKSSVGNRNVYTVPSYRYYFGGGYMEWEDIDAMVGAQVVMNPDFYYYTKDHLGNVRSVVTKNPSTGVVSEVQRTHYYPFGGIIADLSTGTSVQNKLYNGKELDTSNNLWWYDYGARQYDPTAPRFITPDPLAENYYPWNYYTYCINNPIRFIDSDGRSCDNYYFDTQGNQIDYEKNDQPDHFFIQEDSGNIEHSTDGNTLNFVEIKTNSEIGYLSRIIFAEAAGESRISKEAVGEVVKNRVQSIHFPNNYQSVIEQKNQFSSVNPKDKSSWRYYNPASSTNMKEKQAYAESVSAAIKVFNNDSNITSGALLYYSPKSMVPKGSKPKWDFNILVETTPANISSNNFRFFKYK